MALSAGAAALVFLILVLITGCGGTTPDNATPSSPTPAPAPTPAAPLVPAPTPQPIATPVFSPEGEACLACHQSITPGIVLDWERSRHWQSGVDCFSCHGAEDKERSDAFKHNGFTIAIAVTPKDCSPCHEVESQEFQDSRHASANQFIGSLDNFLGEIVVGGPAVNAGCKQCHGSTLATVDGNPARLDPATWPNTGIGRINLDGSAGTCTTCHSRHAFSIAQARQPEVCGKCHIGPDHPQYEVWWESKHGARYYEMIGEGIDMNLDAPAGEWLPGREYSAGPTCASCHISATPNQAVDHDVGNRLSWTLRPPVSTKLPDWEENRDNMLDVCRQCHSSQFSGNFYSQFDALVTLYNEKFAQPAKDIMDELYASGKLTTSPFDEELEWIYFELWHHEGRRARHGASMSGPDYTWWHGMYEVAKHFYNDFLPEVAALDQALVDEVLDREEHRWVKGMDPEEISQILQFYQERYEQ